MSRLRVWAERFFPALTRAFLSARILLDEQGQAKSVKLGRAVDKAGNPLACYTYPALEYLAEFDFTASLVFEFGAGDSSVYWARRAAKVLSVQSDQGWFESISSIAPNNLHVQLESQKEDYVNALGKQGLKFDVIIIDGRWRKSCALTAPDYLQPEGLIVVDNSERYPRSTSALRAKGFLQIDFSGFGPINPHAWTTSLFLACRTKLQAGFRPLEPVGGISYHGPEDA